MQNQIHPVMEQLVEQLLADNQALIDQLIEIVMNGGVNVLLALAIFIIGYLVAGGVKKAAAELMGISQRALSHYLAKYRID